MIKHKKVAELLDRNRKDFARDPFFIVPQPASLHNPFSPDGLKNGAASIDLRLGTWFLAIRQTSISLLDVSEPSELSRRVEIVADMLKLDSEKRELLVNTLVSPKSDEKLARRYHIRFGEDFILHPRSFVLGATLEWFRLPSNVGGYVVGRSSWGRRGLVIATATGVHPGFTGCLTLELANLGDIPIAIRPGMTIGQIFFHNVQCDESDLSVDQSGFACKRAPRLGHPKIDPIAKMLGGGSF